MRYFKHLHILRKPLNEIISYTWHITHKTPKLSRITFLISRLMYNSPPLKSGLALVTCSTHRMWRKWHSWLHKLRVCMFRHFSYIGLSPTLWTVARQAPLSMRLSRQEYWVGCHALLQGIFPTQGSNWYHLHCRWILYPLSYLGSPYKRLLLLLLSLFSHVWLCATPEMAAHQAPPSPGFSRQEHWSGLPFPSPMHESEKWKWSHSVVSDSSWHPGW